MKYHHIMHVFRTSVAFKEESSDHFNDVYELKLLTNFDVNMMPILGRAPNYVLRSFLMCYFDKKHILKLFPLSSCQYVSTIPEKHCMLPTFQKWRFCKSLYGENDGPPI